MTFYFLKNGCELINGIIPITLLKPNKNLQHDQEKNSNSRIDWNEKLGILKIVLQDIDEICISVDPDKKINLPVLIKLQISKIFRLYIIRLNTINNNYFGYIYNNNLKMNK